MAAVSARRRLFLNWRERGGRERERMIRRREEGRELRERERERES